MKKTTLNLYKDEIESTFYEDYKNNPNAVIVNENTENEYLKFHTIEIIKEDEELETCEGCGKEVPLSNMSDDMVMYICNECEGGEE